MKRVDFKTAAEMVEKGSHYMLHLYWLIGNFPGIRQSNNYECSHFLAQEGKDWRNPNTPIILVEKDYEAEAKFEAERLRKEAEQLGEVRDRTYDELREENDLLRRSLLVLLHDSGSPLSTLRNGRVNLEFWVESFEEGKHGELEPKERIHSITANMMSAVDTLCDFYNIARAIINPKDLPNNQRLRNIIAALGDVLKNAEEKRKP